MAVQISGNDITVPRDGSFTRNVTIGGTLTYEDVTNIDSVGLVTARNGIEIGTRPGIAASISVDGNMIVSGISTFGGALSGTTGTFSGAVSGTTGTFSDAVSGTTGTFTGNVAVSGANITVQDSGGTSDHRIVLGAGSDLQFYHNGTDSIINNATGHFYIQGENAVTIKANNNVEILKATGDENMAKFIPDGAVELYFNNSKKIETTSNGVTLSGELNMQGNHLYHADNSKLRLGNGQDLELFHDGTDSFITGRANTRYLKIQAAETRMVNAANSEIVARFIEDGAVELYHDNVLQFSTVTDGLRIHTDKRITRNGNSNNTLIEVTNAQYAKSIYFGGWDSGSNDAGIARVRNSNDNLHIDAGSAGLIYMNAYCTGATFIRDLWPLSNDTYDLGRNSEKWDDVYATNGTIQTSDKNQKNTIIDSDLGLSFVNKLKPVSYKFNSGTRTHYGLIAQDIETVLSDISKSTTDFAGFIKTDLSDEYYQEAEPHIPEGKKEGDLKSAAHTEYGLRYGEFISPLIKAVQELSAENTALKARLDAAGL